MPQLPLVDDFEIGPYLWTDTRRDPTLRFQAGKILLDFANKIPPRDLLCDSTQTRAEDLRLANVAAWNAGGNRYDSVTSRPLIRPALLAPELAKLAELEKVRHTQAIFDGDVRPLVFAMQQGGQVVGAWQWYAIRIIPNERRASRINVDDEQRVADRRSGERIAARAGWFPAILNTTPRQLANRAIDLVQQFVERDYMMQLADGRFLDLVQATAPTIEVSSRPDTKLLQFVRERLEQNAALGKLKLTIRDDPTQPDRKRVRVTAFDIDPIDEPEIDELERGRTGG